MADGILTGHMGVLGNSLWDRVTEQKNRMGSQECRNLHPALLILPSSGSLAKLTPGVVMFL